MGDIGPKEGTASASEKICRVFLLQSVDACADFSDNEDMSLKTLGSFEERVLLAVKRLQPEAYGIPIMELLEEVTGGPVALGAIYTTLDRLETKGYVRSWRSDPTPERGGRAKRMYELQALGEQALHETHRARSRLNVARSGGTG